MTASSRSVHEPAFYSQYSKGRLAFRLLWLFVIFLVLSHLLLSQFLGLLSPMDELAAYAELTFLLLLAVLERITNHPVSTGVARLEDPNEVRALLIEAKTVEPRVPGWEQNPDLKRPENYSQKITDLSGEAERLELIGPDKWAEYQLLPLKQMLIDFNKVDELRAFGPSILDELKEYSEDSSYRYDKEYYGNWHIRIDEAANRINDSDSALDQDNQAEPLRAQLRTVLDHLANYQANWAKGSAYVRSLQATCATAVPILIVMGLLPTTHASNVGFLTVFNWGLLGAAGALTAVMLSLRTSDLVEVGNTQGRREVWRAVLGGVLGFVAGILAFGIVGGGLLSGSAVPTVHGTSVMDISLTIVWGIGAGASLEKVFDRVTRIAESISS